MIYRAALAVLAVAMVVVGIGPLPEARADPPPPNYQLATALMQVAQVVQGKDPCIGAKVQVFGPSQQVLSPRTVGTGTLGISGSCLWTAQNPPPVGWTPWLNQTFNKQIIFTAPNTPILDVNSAAFITSLGGMVTQVAATEGTVDYNFPWYFSAKTTDPLYTIHCLIAGGCLAEGTQIRIPAGALPERGGNLQWAVIDWNSSRECDFVGPPPTIPVGGGTLTVTDAGCVTIGSQAVGGGIAGHRTVAGTVSGLRGNAAGVALTQGLIRPWELLAGHIDHALQIGVDCFAPDELPIYPSDTTAAANNCPVAGLAPYYGMRMWLQMTDAEIDASAMSAYSKIVAKALAHYGGIAVDGGTGGGEVFHLESGRGYTTQNEPDPWAAVAAKFGVALVTGKWTFNFSDIPTKTRAKILDPCFNLGTCPATPTPAPNPLDWRIFTYYTAVESFHTGAPQAVTGCVNFGCTGGNAVALGSYPTDFITAVRSNGSGRFTSGAYVGKFLNYRSGYQTTGYWVDPLPQAANASKVVNVTAARDGVLDGSTIKVTDCGLTTSGGQVIATSTCSLLMNSNWVVHDTFTPQAPTIQQARLYIGEETSTNFEATSPLFVDTSQARITLTQPATAVTWPAYLGAFQKTAPPNPIVRPESAQWVLDENNSFSLMFITDAQVGEQYDYYHPVYLAQNTDPLYTIHCADITFFTRCDPIEGTQIRIPAYAQHAGGTDGHMSVITPDGLTEYDFFFYSYGNPSGTGGTLTVSSGQAFSTTGLGYSPVGWDAGTKGGATSGGASLANGLVRAEEINAGVINHGFFFVGRSCTNGVAVYPAVGANQYCAGNHPMMGTHWVLQMTDAEIDATGAPLYARIINKALAHYGMWRMDSSGATGMSLQPPGNQGYRLAGKPDPWVALAQANGIAHNDALGRYEVDYNLPGVNYSQKMKVLDWTDCNNQGTCGGPVPTPLPTTTPVPTPVPTTTAIPYGTWPYYSVAAPVPGSALNQPIPSNPTYISNSTAIVTNLLSQNGATPGNVSFGLLFVYTDVGGNTYEYSHPIYFAKANDPFFTINCDLSKPPGLYSCSTIQGRSIQIPVAARPAAGTDGHMSVITPDGTQEYSFWQAELGGPGATQAGFFHVTSGMVYDTSGHNYGPPPPPTYQGASTAAGFANSAGLIRGEEINAGVIDHAISIVVRCSNRGAPGAGPVWPANDQDGDCGAPYVDRAPHGTRYYLDLTDAQIDAWPGAYPHQKIIAKALHKYGGFQMDVGGVGMGPLGAPTIQYLQTGTVNPLIGIAQAAGSYYNTGGTPPLNRYQLDINLPGIDLTQHLHALNPTCEQQGTCPIVGATPTPSPTTTPGPPPCSGPFDGAAGIFPCAGYIIPGFKSPAYNQVPANPVIASYSVATINAVVARWPSFETFKAGVTLADLDYDLPMYYAKADGSDPLYTISCYLYGGSCPQAIGKQVHIPNGTLRESQGDWHTAIFDQALGRMCEFYYPPATISGGGALSVGWGSCKDANTNPLTDLTNSSATHGGIGMQSSIVSPQDLLGNNIGHGLQLFLNCLDDPSVYPAPDPTDQGCTNGKNNLFLTGGPYPHYGDWLWLNMTVGEINATAWPQYEKTVAITLATYGGWMMDTGNGGGLGFQVEAKESRLAFGGVNLWSNVASRDGIGITPTQFGNEFFFGFPDIPVNRIQIIDPCVALALRDGRPSNCL